MNVNMNGAPVVGSRQLIGVIAFLGVLVLLLTAIKIICNIFEPELISIALWFSFKLICVISGHCVALFFILKGAKEVPADNENF